jgi:primary-amine oxidase
MYRPALAAFIAALVASPVIAQIHPLDPLSRQELEKGIALLDREKAVGGSVVLALLGFRQPDKAAVLAGRPVPRLATATTYDLKANKTTELVLDLSADRIVDRREVPGVSPPHLPTDNTVAASILKSDSAWRARVRAKGLDPDTVGAFAYPIGAFAPQGTSDRFAIVRTAGVMAYVNLTKGRVHRLVETGGPGAGDARSPFDENTIGPQPESPLRTELRGQPGYRRNGWGVEWGPWSFRIGLTPKEGLTLNLVQYGPPGARRSVMYQGGLSELWVPYGDRGERDFYLNAYDIGEVGIARYGRPEMSRVDCPAHGEFLPVAYLDLQAKPVEVANGFCLYERDGGIAWRHGTVGRRNHQLVLSSVFRVDNYDYGLNWIFNPDGTLEAEVLLTGIMNARPVAHSQVAALVPDTSYATLVAPKIEAMNHQHFFSFRLDMDLAETEGNSVVEMNTVSPPPGPANPHGNAIQLRQTVLASELVARRNLDLSTRRFWRVISGKTRNELGQPVS